MDPSALFLDFDGVIGSQRVWDQNRSRRWTCPAAWLDPALITRLNRLVRRTQAGIVISTSWRRYLGTESVTGLLWACGFTGTVLGATPVLGEGVEQRHLEIAAWLAEHPTDRWIAVDDCPIDLPPGRLVRTITEVGLTDKDVERAVEMLGRV